MRLCFFLPQTKNDKANTKVCISPHSSVSWRTEETNRHRIDRIDSAKWLRIFSGPRICWIMRHNQPCWQTSFLGLCRLSWTLSRYSSKKGKNHDFSRIICTSCENRTTDAIDIHNTTSTQFILSWEISLTTKAPEAFAREQIVIGNFEAHTWQRVGTSVICIVLQDTKHTMTLSSDNWTASVSGPSASSRLNVWIRTFTLN